MKYNVIYDNNKDRIRIRCGKYVLTNEEGYGLTENLLKNNNITHVEIYPTNGSILIEYNKNKKSILRYLNSITQNDLTSSKPSEEVKLQQINRKYKNTILFKIIERTIYKFLLPKPLTLIKTIYDSIPYIKKGLHSLVNLKLNVELLDATTIFMTLINNMYESSGSIVFLLGLSEILENYTIEKTKHSLEQSLMLNIDKVWIQTENNEEVQIPFSEIKESDKIIIRTGTVIPVDGTIISGEAEINQSTMTGESLPVFKKEGYSVFAGTIVENGSIIIEVEKINKETRINQIVKMIENSEKAKANIESKAEQLADSIVPWNFLITILTYILTRNKQKALAALTVDYSCAIKLATPLTIISTMKEASEQKMAVKGGRYLEAYATADTIVFDKTGTLTKASPHIEKVVSMGILSDDEVLRQVACLEEHFPHSVATAIVNEAEKRNLRHSEELHAEVEYIVAHGIASELLGKRVVVGSRHFVLDDEHVLLTNHDQNLIDKNMEKYSIIYLAINGVLEGIICIDDPPRDEAKLVISQLKQLGIKDVIMLTGDSNNAAYNTANMLGITNYKSQVLPEDKAEIIEEIKSQGKKVIMVGDGINDSPALSAANVSVALNDSSDIAREVADVTLLTTTLNDLVTLRLLSQRMLKIINRNYFAITTINSTLLLLGILGVIQPSTTALLHNGSTMLIGLYSANSKNFKNLTTHLSNERINSVV